ncbi:hypothetical protein NW768_005860 [Fusarium equiseti]|uniref:Origin recognition complex subunit 6 n=1 Tax=Fusarium equiseti TaxID=61235 RepID=A0ABQ8RD35_FUSEQ|nr:hypothetical protein NW768_005860 [Fusarium equiseti]
MAKSADDFIQYLHALFGESRLQGRDPDSEFIHLRGIIIEFVSNCSRMTSALAREKCPLTFTDGSLPETRLVLPPVDFNIEEKRSQLNATSNAEEFLEIMRNRSTPKSASKDSKKAHGKKHSLSPPESPRSKVQKRLEAAVASKTKSANEDSTKKHIKLMIRGATDTPKESNDAKTDGRATSPSSSMPQQDSQMEDASAPSTEKNLPALCRSEVLEIVTAAQNITVDQWEEFKPKLLGMLDQLQADPTPKQSEAAVARLQSAIAIIGEERSLIPPEAWNEYEEKLIKKAKDGDFDADWSTRRSKIGKIIWQEEELVAMGSRDWERLRAAARTWTILAEVTGPIMEGDEQRSNGWLLQKLGDVDFQEKLFACRDRLAAITGRSEATEDAPADSEEDQ